MKLALHQLTARPKAHPAISALIIFANTDALLTHSILLALKKDRLLNQPSAPHPHHARTLSIGSVISTMDKLKVLASTDVSSKKKNKKSLLNLLSAPHMMIAKVMHTTGSATSLTVKSKEPASIDASKETSVASSTRSRRPLLRNYPRTDELNIKRYYLTKS